MYYLAKTKIKLAAAVNKALGDKSVSASDFVKPARPEHGDLSLPLFGVAKKSGQNPAQLAPILAKKLKLKIAAVVAAGPYLNFSLPQTAVGEVLKEINKQGVKYGHNKNQAGERIMIEFSNANTHKEYHVGHLRNLCFGDAVARLLAANGAKAVPVSYINDFGIHAAKCLWWLDNDENKAGRKMLKQLNPSERGQFLGQTYAEAVKQIGEDEVKKKEVAEVMQQLESRYGDPYKLWQTTRKWSIAQMQAIYRQLDIRFARTYYESEIIANGLAAVNNLLAKNILKKSAGAVIADLQADNLGVLVILRADGTALYPVADLALAQIKAHDYKLSQSLYVVDVRQSLYFQQLFKILQTAGHQETLRQLAYEFVKLPTGMMSSRSGQVITYEQLIDQAMIKAVDATANKHLDWDQEKIRATAVKIALATLKWEMIKVSPGQIITFDLDEALKFDGYTATYLLYTYARLQSIARKAEAKNSSADQAELLTDKLERALAVALARYPEIVVEASARFEPSVLAQFLFDLARQINDYYHQVKILQGEENVQNARLGLIDACGRVLDNGLDLLGIGVVEEI